MGQFNGSVLLVVLVAAFLASTLPSVTNAESYMVTRAKAARKAADDADALTQTALADYNDKVKAEAAAKKAVDDADADLAAAQADITTKKKQLDDSKVKGEQARQTTLQLKQAAREEQEFSDDLEMQADEADNSESQSAQDVIDAQARSNLTAELLTEQIAIVKEATDDSTYYSRQAAKLKTPAAQAEALEAQQIRTQAIRIQAELTKQAQRAVDRVGRMQFEFAANSKDKTETRGASDNHKAVVAKAKKDASDMEAFFYKCVNETKTLDAAVKQQGVVIAAKTKAAKDARVPLAKAATLRLNSEGKYNALKTRSDGLKGAADKADKDAGDFEASQGRGYAYGAANNNGNGNGNSR